MSHVTRQISRRSMLRAAGATAGAVGAGIGTTAAPAAAAGASFAHPGLLHTRADLDRMAAKVKAGAQPHTAGFARLAANPHAQSGWRPRPSTVVHRGAGTPQNYAALYKDIHAAYQNALRWHITGERAHADTAVAVLNAWSGTLTQVAGSADRFLAAGLYGYQFANAAELVRDHEDFEAERFRKMLLDVFHPLSESFLAHHNNAVVSNYWTNWDLCNMACVLAVGIHCDDRAKVERAVEYFKHGEGLGSIRNAIPVVHDDGLGEWLEAGRDQGHALLGVGLMGTICEMAWNQGIDLYGHDDSRFLKGAQYVAKWAMGEKVPFTANTRRKGAIGGWSGSETVTEAAPVNPEMTRPIWAMIANHYTGRRGLSASYLTRIAAKSAPEGGGGDYGPDSGGYDQLGFGTLAFTRDRSVKVTGAGSDPRPQAGPTASPSPSAAGDDLAATGSDGLLGWTAATGVTALAGGLLLLRRRAR
ncbi:alginate lyase family protein [Streptomyces sp. HUAS 31]|uniref:alginate lyase family protein n=1 Tax=Streptomyces TaxID=1883 RepID=UPI002305FCC6|nr:alginate lyase family protein [Streptomyces sp. HUAS 31]WCD97180.1 alginate lyase family protein [Streptomyces sp. HUAS 31]